MIKRIDARLGAGEIEAILTSRSVGENEGVRERVKGILSDVRKNGDEALFKYSRMFDGVEIDKSSIRVPNEEIEKAYAAADKDFIEALEAAAAWTIAQGVLHR